MDEAKKLPGGNHVIDGVKYFLSRKVNDTIQTVSKHSPDENSFTGKILSLMTALAAYAKAEDEDRLNEVNDLLEDLKSM
jgi:hypothetical protein